MELIARRVIAKLEGTTDVPPEIIAEYTNPDSERYKAMQQGICEDMGFTSLRFNRLDDMCGATGIPRENLCTYCWDGRE